MKTFLTKQWKLKYPIIGAPMAYVGKGRLANAVTQGGGLGMIGVGSKESVEYIANESSIARGPGRDAPFGIGLMGWAIKRRPELLDASLKEKPFLISISFGYDSAYVKKVHDQGIYLAVQVHSTKEAIQAEKDGVDLIVVQGSEAGGHTNNQVSTLPLLQSVLEVVKTPVVAAGGIGTPRGVVACLMAGAEGVWVGTCLLASPECDNTEEVRKKILKTEETDTILTSVFDIAQNIPWPPQYPGRAIKNKFTEEWHNKTTELKNNNEASTILSKAIKSKDYDTAHIYAGQSVGLVKEQISAKVVIENLGAGAEKLLKERYNQMV